MTPFLVIYLYGWVQVPLSPTVDDILRVMGEAADAVKTAQVVYLSEESNIGLTPDETAFLRRAYREHPDQMPRAARLMELNKTTRRERVSLNVDVGAGVWRSAAEDLRDVNGLMEREGIPREQRGFLDRTSVVLVSDDISVKLVRSVPYLSVTERQTAVPLVFQSELPLGVIWDGQFERAARTSITSCASQGLLCLTLEDTQGGKTVLEVDPAIGHRFRSLKIYSPQGKLMVRTTNDDYRLVDGIRLAFAEERTEFDGMGNVKRHQKRMVQRARFNQALEHNALQLVIPAGTRVYGSAGAANEIIKQERVMDMAEVRAVYGSGAVAASQPARSVD